MDLRKEATFFRPFIGGAKAVIQALVRQFPLAFNNRGGRNLAKLYAKGVVAPYADAMTKGRATKALLNNANAYGNEARNNLLRWSDTAEANLVNTVGDRGFADYVKRNDKVLEAINTAQKDPRIGKLNADVYNHRHYFDLASGAQKDISFSGANPATRQIKLDDVGSISPHIAYHELGHLDNSSRIAKFLQRRAVENTDNVYRVLEELRANFNSYARMSRAGFPHAQAAEVAYGFPSYLYSRLPTYAAKTGIATGKYGIPAASAGAGGYGVYKYIQNNQRN